MRDLNGQTAYQVCRLTPPHTHTHNPRHPSLKRSHRRRLLIKTAALPPAHYTKGSLSSSTPAVSVLLTGCLVTEALIAFRRVSRCLFRLFSRGRRCVRACVCACGRGRHRASSPRALAGADVKLRLHPQLPACDYVVKMFKPFQAWKLHRGLSAILRMGTCTRMQTLELLQ